MLHAPSRRCTADEVNHPYHRRLIDALPGDDCLGVLRRQRPALHDLASSISTDQVDQVHAPYQWSVRQVFVHLAEAERVFGDRMLRVAAGDPAPLAGWDENAYATARYGLGNFDRIVAELDHLRQANLMLLDRLAPRCWDQIGQLDAQPVTLRVLAWFLPAHFHHHLEIIRRRVERDAPA